ncbi:Histone-lysine N-methyltransferase SETD2 [Eumeta japonica]|uniref:Histone-lysine N-methyltransferase SETD2 n=1 Tax=Eumeta variegata TaxID=151549 RepID=A0A4C1U2L1_EUMVA|nr:Histone-lysine N-methyltransferase SETD2 [Eumeta japonica]
MAKRRKPAGPTTSTRRSTRRTKGQKAGEGPSTDSEAAVPPDPPATNASDKIEDQQLKEEPKPSSSSTEQLEAVADLQLGTENVNTGKKSSTWHKNFGKFRFLFNNDEVKNCSSDSETNSSIEIRVVDPCATSESDSNTAIDGQAEHSITINLSPATSTTSSGIQINSADDSPTTSVSLNTVSEIPEQEEEAKIKPSMDTDTALSEECQTTNNIVSIEHVERLQNNPIIIEPNDLEEEIITVVQIVEDDNQELYYDIKIDSPKQSSVIYQSDRQNKDEGKDVNCFQKNFEMLHLNEGLDTSKDLMLSNESTCMACDVPLIKDSVVDSIPRPDPSVTPSSILSDDSNSSKVLSDANQPNSNDSAESSPTAIRRSSRIKTISTLKQKTKGYGLVKTPLKKALMTQTKLKQDELCSENEKSGTDLSSGNSSNSPSFPVPSDMPVKVKSRWRRSSELEMNTNSPVVSPLASPSLPQKPPPKEEEQTTHNDKKDINMNYEKIIEERMNQYRHLDENEYLCDRMISRDTKKMICDCFLTKEEIERGELGFGEDCLNRLLMIECNYRCPVGDRCTNRRFQKRENGPLKVFFADKKGCGVEANIDIPAGEFLMEYVGEVLDYDKFYERAQAYSSDNNLHHYFMSLKGDTVIDATMKGNISRFINHSCDPNAETQKWTVNGELRIGFFSKRDIKASEEITFDYQFQRFGKIAQRCYCGANNCRGWIGAEPDSDEEDEEEEDDVSTSKAGLESAEREVTEGGVQDQPSESPLKSKRPPRPRRRYPVRPKPELELDADIEDDIEALTRTGIKNQSHTLLLSRTMVRAKSRRAQTSLLRLLRDADLPCRRLFLDYRGLRLLAPWCTEAPLDFRLEMLLTVDRLPITNKTMVQESRFFTIVERWLKRHC